MSNGERQRRFRERNPGYYGRLHRKRKAEILALHAARMAAAEAVVAKPEPLRLPAHAQDPAMDALNALSAALKSDSTAERLTIPAARSKAA
jgi:hypothetical protein